MLLPTETNLRAILERYTAARANHDARPIPQSSRMVDDCVYTLCVMTGTRTPEDALLAADAMLEQYRIVRCGVTQADEALAA